MLVRDLMSAPAITCGTDATLSKAAETMRGAEIGSLVVTDQSKVARILTERDLLRAAAAGVDPVTDAVGLWMTANPDALGRKRTPRCGQVSLTTTTGTSPGRWRGPHSVVSIRDLLVRPACGGRRTRSRRPTRLEGVSSPPRRSATSAAARASTTTANTRPSTSAARSFEDVWYCCSMPSSPTGRRPRHSDRGALDARTALCLAELLPAIARTGKSTRRPENERLAVRRQSSVEKPVSDGDLETVLGGPGPVRCGPDDSGHRLPHPKRARACRPERRSLVRLQLSLDDDWHGTRPRVREGDRPVLIIATDHGFNASTFTARVITRRRPTWLPPSAAP